MVCSTASQILVGWFKTNTFQLREFKKVIFKVRWERGAGLKPISSARMRKPEFGGMKKLSGESGKHDLAGMDLRCGAIECVSDERMLERGEVYADLMRSSGVELDFDEGCGGELQEFAPFGECFTHLAGGSVFARF